MPNKTADQIEERNQKLNEIRNAYRNHTMVNGVTLNYADMLSDIKVLVYEQSDERVKESEEYKKFLETVTDAITNLGALVSNDKEAENGREFKLIGDNALDVIDCAMDLIESFPEQTAQIELPGMVDLLTGSLKEGLYNPKDPESDKLDNMYEQILDSKAAEQREERERLERERMARELREGAAAEEPEPEPEPEPQPEPIPDPIVPYEAIQQYYQMAYAVQKMMQGIKASELDAEIYNPNPDEIIFEGNLQKTVNALQDMELNGGTRSRLSEAFEYIKGSASRIVNNPAGNSRDNLAQMMLDLYSLADEGDVNPEKSITDIDQKRQEEINNKLRREFVFRRNGQEQADSQAELDDIIRTFTKEEKERYQLIKRNNEVIKAANLNKVMSERTMVMKTILPEYRPVGNMAQPLFDILDKGKPALQRAKSRTKLKPYDSKLDRVIGYFMDVSGTEEAEKANDRLLNKLSNREGYEQFISELVTKMVSLKMDQVYFHNEDEAAAFISEHPIEAALGYAIADIQRVKDENIEPEKKELLQSAGYVLSHLGSANGLMSVKRSRYCGTFPDNLTEEELAMLLVPLNNRIKSDIENSHEQISLEDAKNELEDYSKGYMFWYSEANKNSRRILKEIDAGKFTKPLYALQAKNQDGNIVSISDGIRLYESEKPVTFEEKSAQDIRKAEEIIGDGQHRMDIQPDNEPADEDMIENDEERREYIARRDNMSEFQKQRYELIKQNNEVLKNCAPDIVMSEEDMIERATDLEAEKMYNAMAGYREWQVKAKAELEASCKEIKGGIQYHINIAKLVLAEMDVSETEEAKQKNINLVKSLVTKEGQIKFAEQWIRNTVSRKLSDFIPESEEELVDRLQKDPGEFIRMQGVCEIASDANKTQKIDPVLCELVNTTKSAIAMAESTGAIADYFGSPYYNTIPEPGENDLMQVHCALNALKSKYGKFNLNKLTKSMGDVRKCRKLIDEAKLDKPIYMYNTEHSGQQYTLNDAIDELFKTGEQSYKVVEKSPEEIARIESCLAGHTINEANNQRDFAKEYDDVQAALKKLQEDYKAAQPDKTLASLGGVMCSVGYSIVEPEDMGHLRAIVPDENGVMRVMPIFMEEPEKAVGNEEKIFEGQTRFDNLTMQRQLEILKLLNEGRVFLVTPGADISTAEQIYIQKDGKIGLFRKNTYYNVDNEREQTLRAVSEEAKRGVKEAEANKLANMLPDERQKYLNQQSKDRDFWKKKRDNVRVDTELWYGIHYSGAIVEKAKKLAEQAVERGINKENFLTQMKNIVRVPDISAENIKKLFEDSGVTVKFQKVSDKEHRKELSDKAFSCVMGVLYDYQKNAYGLDNSDPAVLEVVENRGLKAILMDGGEGSAEANINLCRRWHEGSNEEKAEILNERFRRLYGEGFEGFDENMSDEELVENYPRIYDRCKEAVELISTLASLEDEGIKLDEDAHALAMKNADRLMNKAMIFNSRMGIIANSYYSELDVDALMHSNEISNELDNIDVEPRSEANKLLCSIKNYYHGITGEIEFRIVKHIAPGVEERKAKENLVYFDENGKNLGPSDLYWYYKKKHAMYVYKKGDPEVRALKFEGRNMNSKLVDNTDPAVEKVRAELTKAAKNIDFIDHKKLNNELDWKKAVGDGLKGVYQDLYDKLDAVDPLYIRSSSAFGDVKTELSRLGWADHIVDADEARQSLADISKLCEKYISDKNALVAKGKSINKERLEAMKSVHKSVIDLMLPHRVLASEEYKQTGQINTEARIEDINKITLHQPMIKPVISSITAEEKVERQQLSKLLMEKKSKEIPFDEWKRPEGPVGQERFDSEYLMTLKRNQDDPEPTVEEQAENARIQAAFADPKNHVRELTVYMNRMYEMVANLPLDKVFEHGMPSDRQIVEHYEEYNKMASMLGQIQNYNAFVKAHNIPVNAELREKVKNKEHYTNFANLMRWREHIISDRFYSELRPEDLKGTVLQVKQDDRDISLEDLLNGISKKMTCGEINGYADAVKEEKIADAQLVADLITEELGLEYENKKDVRVLFLDGSKKVGNFSGLEAGGEKDAEMVAFDVNNPDKQVYISKGGVETYLKERALRQKGAETTSFIINPNSENFDDLMRDALKTRYGMMANFMKSADTRFTWSSEEFAGIREELNNVLTTRENLTNSQILESTDKLQKLADKYIGKKTGKKLDDFEQKRLDAVKRVKETVKNLSNAATAREKLKSYFDDAVKARVKAEADRKREIEAGENKAFEEMPEDVRALSILMSQPVDFFKTDLSNGAIVRVELIGHYINGGKNSLNGHEAERMELANRLFNELPEGEKKAKLTEGLGKLVKGVNDYVATLSDIDDKIEKAAGILNTIKEYMDKNKEYIDPAKTINKEEFMRAKAASEMFKMAKDGEEAREKLITANEKGPEYTKLLTDYLVSKTVRSAMAVQAAANKESIRQGVFKPNLVQLLNLAGGNSEAVKNEIVTSITESPQYRQLASYSVEQMKATIVNDENTVERMSKDMAKGVYVHFAEKVMNTGSNRKANVPGVSALSVSAPVTGHAEAGRRDPDINRH